jgi:hypothetical protein
MSLTLPLRGWCNSVIDFLSFSLFNECFINNIIYSLENSPMVIIDLPTHACESALELINADAFGIQASSSDWIMLCVLVLAGTLEILGSNYASMD